MFSGIASYSESITIPNCKYYLSTMPIKLFDNDNGPWNRSNIIKQLIVTDHSLLAVIGRTRIASFDPCTQFRYNRAADRSLFNHTRWLKIKSKIKSVNGGVCWLLSYLLVNHCRFRRGIVWWGSRWWLLQKSRCPPFGSPWSHFLREWTLELSTVYLVRR